MSSRAILGSAHYPVTQGAFSNALPAGTEVMDQPAIITDSLSRYLPRRPGTAALGRPVGASPGLLTTGDPNAVGPLAHSSDARAPSGDDGWSALAGCLMASCLWGAVFG